VNDGFDMLNSHKSSKKSEKFKAPFSHENKQDFEKKKNEIQTYLESLKYIPADKTSSKTKARKNDQINTSMIIQNKVTRQKKKNVLKKVLHSRIGTGFESLYYGLESAFQLGCFLLEKGQTKFFVHRCSQDHIEQFFSAIRGRNGFNNRPTPRLFMAAYRALLLNAEIKIANGNTELIDSLPVFNISKAIPGKFNVFSIFSKVN
jgi:hypothetical protein